MEKSYTYELKAIYVAVMVGMYYATMIIQDLLFDISLDYPYWIIVYSILTSSLILACKILIEEWDFNTIKQHIQKIVGYMLSQCFVMITSYMICIRWSLDHSFTDQFMLLAMLGTTISLRIFNDEQTNHDLLLMYIIIQVLTICELLFYAHDSTYHMMLAYGISLSAQLCWITHHQTIIRISYIVMLIVMILSCVL